MSRFDKRPRLTPAEKEALRAKIAARTTDKGGLADQGKKRVKAPRVRTEEEIAISSAILARELAMRDAPKVDAAIAEIEYQIDNIKFERAKARAARDKALAKALRGL